MLIDVSLKVEIKVKRLKDNKFHEYFFRNILNPLMPKIPIVRYVFKILQ